MASLDKGKQYFGVYIGVSLLIDTATFVWCARASGWHRVQPNHGRCSTYELLLSALPDFEHAFRTQLNGFGSTVGSPFAMSNFNTLRRALNVPPPQVRTIRSLTRGIAMFVRIVRKAAEPARTISNLLPRSSSRGPLN